MSALADGAAGPVAADGSGPDAPARASAARPRGRLERARGRRGRSAGGAGAIGSRGPGRRRGLCGPARREPSWRRRGAAAGAGRRVAGRLRLERGDGGPAPRRGGILVRSTGAAGSVGRRGPRRSGRGGCRAERDGRAADPRSGSTWAARIAGRCSRAARHGRGGRRTGRLERGGGSWGGPQCGGRGRGRGHRGPAWCAGGRVVAVAALASSPGACWR